jgi:hypothetical protein
VVGWIPSSYADDFERGIEDGRVMLEDWYGADTASSSYTWSGRAGEYGADIINVAGLARAGSKLGIKAVTHARDSKRLVNVARAWLNNRSLSKSLSGARPQPNATVRDLGSFKPGNPQKVNKLTQATERSDADLLNSVFAPRDKQFIATNPAMSNTILQGNHRVYQLLQRADDPTNLNITYDTPIFINRGGLP